MSVNKVILIGRLGNDPDVRNTPNGMAVANFNVATNENWSDKAGQKQEKTEWHKVVVWGKLAELCGEYLAKGRQVYLEGRLQTRQWQDKENQTRYTTEIVANTVQFLGAAAGAGASNGAYAPKENAQRENGMDQSAAPNNFKNVAMEQPSFTEEDIPF